MELCRIALRRIVSTTDLAAEFSKQRGYGMLFFARGREQANSRFFFSILIVLLSPVIFCKALAFPLQQLANRYKRRLSYAACGFFLILPFGS